MTDPWKHDALAEDLSAHLRGYSKPMLCWLDMQLGPAGSPRPDVFALDPSYSALRSIAFECKVSRADFLRDAQAGKALGYRKFAGALSFAAPKGLITKGELPEGCGLIERGPDSWRWARRPVVSTVELPWRTWMKLVIDGIERARDPRAALRIKQANEYRQQDLARKRLGDELGQMLADRDAARYRLQQEIDMAKSETESEREKRRTWQSREREEAQRHLDALYAEMERLCKELGIEGTHSPHRIRDALARLRPEHDALELAQAKAELERAAERMKESAERIGLRIVETKMDAAA
jgi:hypothetical protein